MKEDLLHKQVAYYLSLQEKQFNIKFWTYNASGEKRPPITGALLKAKGLKRGIPDYTIILNNGIILWLECKTGNNKQTPEQIDFENMIKTFNNQFYFIIRSIEDLEEVFEFNKF